MGRPKWFLSDQDVEICDVVLFIKNEGSMVNTNQYGMVHEMKLDRDGLIQKVAIKYRNSSKNIDYFITCALGELVLIYLVCEINVMKELENLPTKSSIVSVDV